MGLTAPMHGRGSLGDKGLDHQLPIAAGSLVVHVMAHRKRRSTLAIWALQTRLRLAKRTSVR